MPGFDQTGPLGQGPRTGKNLGRCNDNLVYDHGCRNYQYGYSRKYLSNDEEIQGLQEISQNLKADLKAIEERIKEIKK